MNCADVRPKLDDYVDGELPGAELHELELHVAGCEACRAEERALRALLAQAAALPRSAAPARNLWPEIASEIGTSSRGGRLLLFRRRPALAGGLLAAAAALLLALVVRPSGFRSEGSSTPADRARGASSATPAPTLAVAASTSAVEGAEAEYERATRALLETLEAHKDELGPETLRSVERNLAVIDEALREVRTALAAEPGNPELTRMLVATHRKKVDVLRRVVKLSTSRL